MSLVSASAPQISRCVESPAAHHSHPDQKQLKQSDLQISNRRLEGEVMAIEPELTKKSPAHMKISQSLKELFQQLAGKSMEEVETTASFFQLGADSIFLLRASQAIQDRFGVKIPFRMMYEEVSSIDALATYLLRQNPQGADSLTEAVAESPKPGDEKPPVQPNAQRRASALRAQDAEPVILDQIELPQHLKLDGQHGASGGSFLQQIVMQQLEVMAEQLRTFQKISLGVPVEPDRVKQAISEQIRRDDRPRIESGARSRGASEAAAESTPARVNGPSTAKDHIDVTRVMPYEVLAVTRDSAGALDQAQRSHLQHLVARVTTKTAKSKLHAQKYRRVLADNRATAGFNLLWKEIQYPLIIKRAFEARLCDIDDNEYLDLAMGFGALLFGHSPSFVEQAIKNQIERGIQLGGESELAGKNAELICEMTGVERATFCNSGTEAVMTALRLARTVTGRTKVVLFEGCYHGMFDGVLVRGERGSDGRLMAAPAAPGIPRHMIENIILSNLNDPHVFETIESAGNELAAVLIEPLPSRFPDFQPRSFLQELRKVTARTGAALIFDEVVTGFRFHQGGAQALFGVEADIVTFGKSIGAGLPVAAVAGKSVYLDAVDGGYWTYGDASYPRAEATFFAGTYFKHPFIMAPVAAVLSHLKDSGPQLQRQIDTLTASLVEALNEFFKEEDVPIRMLSFGSLFRFQPTGSPKFMELFYYYLLERGVFVCETRTCYLSTAHTERDCQHAFQTIIDVVREMQSAGFLPAKKRSARTNGTRTRRASVVAGSLQSPQTISRPEPLVSGKSAIAEDLTEVRKIPLTEGQKDIWIAAQLGEEASRAYAMSLALRLEGMLDTESLRIAFQETIQRHEALRITCGPKGDFQFIHSRMQGDMPLVDFSHLPVADREQRLAAWLDGEVLRPFDFLNGPLVRAAIARLETEHHLLLINIHHIVTDGISNAILLRDMAALYSAHRKSAPTDLPAPIPFSAYALKEGATEVEDDEYWLKVFADSIPVLELPSSRQRPPLRTYAGSLQILKVEPDVWSQIKPFCSKQGCTSFVLLLAAFEALLYRLTNQSDLVVGVPAAGQLQMGLNQSFGYHINMLPLRARVDGDTTVAGHLHHTSRLLVEAYEHQKYSFSNLVKRLYQTRDLSRSPLYTVAFNLDRSGTMPEFFGLRASLDSNSNGTARFDLEWNITEGEDDLLIECRYNVDLLHEDTIKRWMRHYVELLHGIADNPRVRLSELEILTGAERNELLIEWNASTADIPINQGVHDLVEQQAARTPEALAVISDNEQLSYAALCLRYRGVASQLQRRGVGPECVIAVLAGRSIDLVTSMLALSRLGAAFLLLDSSYTSARLTQIISQSKCPFVLVGNESLKELSVALESLPPEHRPGILHIAELLQNEPDQELPSHCYQNGRAYVLYTSGSTGVPKGAMVEQEGMINHLFAKIRDVDLREGDVLAHTAPLSFDIAVFQFLGPLISGATVRIVNDLDSLDPQRLVEMIESNHLSVIEIGPSMLGAMIDRIGRVASQPPKLSSLRWVIATGEALSPEICRQWLKLYPHIPILNAYGLTECSDDVAHYKITEPPAMDEPHIPIGGPVINLQLHVLDSRMSLAPVGVAGELYVGGIGVGRGYLCDPSRTAEAFVPNPLARGPGARLYKTGDLCRRRLDGKIEFLGRIDHQVKLWGQRIELGEIESVIRQHPSVRDALLTTWEDIPGDKRLVAYVVLTREDQSSEAEANAQSLEDERISQWQAVYNQTYSKLSTEKDIALDFTGWNSSYTRAQIPQEEMLEWVDHTVNRILSYKSARVLEIGCGSGLLLLRLAEVCNKYVGTDLSQVGLHRIQEQLKRANLQLTHLALSQRKADDFDGLEPKGFDLVLLNSVVQYFPSINYLLRVLERAVNAVDDGGVIFIGDVRSLHLLDLLHTSIQMLKPSSTLTRVQFLEWLKKRVEQEGELIIDPAFFTALKQRLPRISYFEVMPKRGSLHNELTCFRYDVALHVGKSVPAVTGIDWLDWREQNLTLQSLKRHIIESAPELIGLKDVPNARLEPFAEFKKAAETRTHIVKLSDLSDAFEASNQSVAQDPEDFYKMATELNYSVALSWLGTNSNGGFDVLLKRTESAVEGMSCGSPPVWEFERQPLELKSWDRYASDPLQRDLIKREMSLLRSFLQERLPSYMIPSSFVLLDALPLTPNGKIDRKMLPPPDQPLTADRPEYVGPRTQTEQVLAEIWSQVLDVEQPGINDNFFALGGDSIGCIQVSMRALQAGIEMGPTQLFQHQTIAELAAAASRIEDQTQEQPVGTAPLTPIQLWFFQQSLPDHNHFNQAQLLKVNQPLNLELAQKALQLIVIHHDALRARFSNAGNGWQQVFTHTDAAAPVKVMDLSSVAELQRSAHIELTATQVQQSLNITNGPLIGMALFEFGDDEPGRLLIVIHHLAVDAVSWRILLEDFDTVYRQLESQTPTELPAKTTSFEVWANRLESYANSEACKKEIDYWLGELSAQVWPLPVDHQGGINTEASAQRVSVWLEEAETSQLLTEVTTASRASIGEILLSALVLALSRWAGARSFAIDVESHGREQLFDDVDLSRTVGWFTSIIPVVLTAEESLGIEATLKATKNKMRRMPNGGIGYGMSRYLNKDPRVSRQMADLPRREIAFNYIGQFANGQSDPSRFTQASESAGPTRSLMGIRCYRLEVLGTIANDRLNLIFVYSQNLHRRASIENLAQEVLEILRALISEHQPRKAHAYAPSDFPGIQISQKELDELIEELS
jgi:amino acid adenylation domain-containing protein/non-ribosomal peptide synthase protein (TIGR01720 family)